MNMEKINKYFFDRLVTEYMIGFNSPRGNDSTNDGMAIIYNAQKKWYIPKASIKMFEVWWKQKLGIPIDTKIGYASADEIVESIYGKGCLGV